MKPKPNWRQKFVTSKDQNLIAELQGGTQTSAGGFYRAGLVNSIFHQTAAEAATSKLNSEQRSSKEANGEQGSPNTSKDVLARDQPTFITTLSSPIR
ncbi:hypothetical protein L0F63_003102 [Massospora cicadina]|nr:hypothetical protein L0F63_003102 [Massospora cicadina]